MKPTLDQVYKQVKALTPRQQRALANRIMKAQTPFEDSEVESAWAKEIKRRVDEVNAGKADLISWDEVEKDLDREMRRLTRAQGASPRGKRN